MKMWTRIPLLALALRGAGGSPATRTLRGQGARATIQMPWLALLLLALFASRLPAQSTQPTVRFAAYDVIVDSADASLAAYQVQIVGSANVTLVGVEGGEHPAFAKPPYYDPKALQGQTIILAAFSKEKDLPHSRTRVARIHVRIEGDAAPTFETKLIVAGNAGGQSIPAKLSLEEFTAREKP